MARPGPARRDTLAGLTRVAAAGLIWGTIPLVLRASDGSPLVKVFFRVAIAALVLLAVLAATGKLSDLRRLDRRTMLGLAGLGVILAVNWLLFIYALDMTKVAVAELLGYTGPVFVAVLAPFVTGESFDRRVVLPLALALAGIVVILAPQGLQVSSPRELLGAGLAFLSALTYAMLLLRSKRLMADVSGSTLMFFELAVAALLLLPFAIWMYATGQGPSGWVSYGALITLGVVHTGLAGILFIGGLGRVRTDHAAVLSYTEPASAVLFAAAFLWEPLTLATIAGGAMVIAGGALVARIAPLEVGFGQEAADIAPAGPETVPTDPSGDAPQAAPSDAGSGVG